MMSVFQQKKVHLLPFSNNFDKNELQSQKISKVFSLKRHSYV